MLRIEDEGIKSCCEFCLLCSNCLIYWWCFLDRFFLRLLILFITLTPAPATVFYWFKQKSATVLLLEKRGAFSLTAECLPVGLHGIVLIAKPVSDLWMLLLLALVRNRDPIMSPPPPVLVLLFWWSSVKGFYSSKSRAEQVKAGASLTSLRMLLSSACLSSSWSAAHANSSSELDLWFLFALGRLVSSFSALAERLPCSKNSCKAANKRVGLVLPGWALEAWSCGEIMLLISAIGES